MPKNTAENPIAQKSIVFAVKIVKTVNSMPKTPAGFAIGDQLVRSGTSIGANIQEAQRGRSKKDFKNCLQISLKEASECRYWLFIAESAELIKKNSLSDELEEIIKILFTIIKKLN